MRFYNHKSSILYDIYVKIYDGDIELEKKKIILKSLLAGESWSWKITGISKQCLESFKKNKFEKSRKLKKSRKTVSNVVRHQNVSFSLKVNELFKNKLSEVEWWDKVFTNEKTHLITKDELKSDYYLYTNIPEDGGYFLNNTTGYLFGEKERLFLKHLYKKKIIWKRSNDILNN